MHIYLAMWWRPLSCLPNTARHHALWLSPTRRVDNLFRYPVIISAVVRAFPAMTANHRHNRTFRGERCHYTLYRSIISRAFLSLLDTHYTGRKCIYVCVCVQFSMHVLFNNIYISRDALSFFSECYVGLLSGNFIMINLVQVVQYSLVSVQCGVQAAR